MDAHSLRCPGIFADGHEIDAGPRLIKEEPGAKQKQQAQIGHWGGGEQRAQDGNVREPGNVDILHQVDGDERIRHAEIASIEIGHQRRAKDIQRHAVDDLPGPQGDGAEGIDHIQCHAAQRTQQQSHPGAARKAAAEKSGDGTDAHNTVEADIR